MKDKNKKKGGQRAGAGRKPSGRQKEAVTIYVDVSLFGGKVGARVKLYELWNGAITDTGKKIFIPLDGLTEEAAKEIKEVKISDLTKPSRVLKPKEQPKTNFSINTIPNKTATPVAIQAMIEAVMAEKIPKERDTPMGRRMWAIDQHKRIQELKEQLIQ